jgi:acyl carrier protein
MVPSSLVLLDALPLAVGGKLDRAALPEPGRARPPLATPLVAPRDEVERQLARIWAEVLGLEEVGVEDDFLGLGGDSLLAAQVVSRAVDTFLLDLPMQSLYDSPTVSAMALAIGRVARESADREALERQLAGIDTLSDVEAQELLARRAGRGPDV